jgi:peroxiredoxin
VELQVLQLELDKIKELGANLVAISPQLPVQTLDLTAQTGLDFEMLYDPGNQTAKEFGLVFALAEELKPVYSGFGIDLPKSNGDDSFELPIPATYVIGRDGTVLYEFVDTNHTNRPEPSQIVAALKK